MRPYQPRQRPLRPDCVVHLPEGPVEAFAPDVRICGARATIKIIEQDPRTGWCRAHWFCRRHTDRAEEVRQQLSTRGPAPEPIPNTGGLLPCYFTADWRDLYSRHLPGWTPPYHGLRADQWPTPQATYLPRPPRLAIVSAEPVYKQDQPRPGRSPQVP